MESRFDAQSVTDGPQELRLADTLLLHLQKSRSDMDGSQVPRLDDTLLPHREKPQSHQPETSYSHDLKDHWLFRKRALNGGYESVKAASKRVRIIRHHLRWTGTWTWEVASSIVAIASFACIVVLLARLNDKPVPEWPSGLSVNAILSVLVTVMKGAIGVTVAECLSQLKWSWFRHQRKLADLSTLDDASRGVWGATVLLLTWRKWYLAYLGAFVFLAGFIIGPTIQLTVEVRVREVKIPSPAASVPICNSSYFNATYLGFDSPDDSRRDSTFDQENASWYGSLQAQLPMIGAIYEGLLQISKENTLRPFCPSGNCTFPPYQSLGFCNECVDMTDKLRFYVGGNETNADRGIPPVNSTVSHEYCGDHRHICKAELPGYGVTLDQHGLINTTIDSGTKRIEPSPTPAGYLLSILNRNTKDLSKLESFSAVECTLRMCIKTYEGAVRLGRFEEKVVSSTWANSTDGGTYLTLPADPCYVDGNRKTPPYSKEDEDRCVYNVTMLDLFAMHLVLDEMLSGHGTNVDGKYPSWTNPIMPSLWGAFDFREDWYSPTPASLGTVNRAMTSLADVLSNRIRGSPSICEGASVSGTQLSDQLYLHVNWRWLGPTFAVLVLSVVFFAAIVLQSSGETLWKSSIFAYLIGHPRVGGEVLSAQDMLEAAEAELKGAVRSGPVPAMLRMSCDKMDATFDTATIRFRTRGGEAQ